MKKKLFNKSAITNIIIGALMVTLIISPQAKALMIEGCMKIGFFQPPTGSTVNEKENTGNTAIPYLLLKSSDGKTLNIQDLKGKVILINFWATWCPPCVAEMPSINALYKRFKNNPHIVIFPVDVDNNFSKSVPFMKKNAYALPVYNLASQMPEGYLGNAIPTTVILDKTGKMVLRHEGGADYTNKKFVEYLEGIAK
ncbi:TlpA family protein disulfide reductase [Mucilaginibacter gotjawali]|uniref:Thiol-disulfide oxidoreductase ResA n=2 Tax=Mucilaginibacter gotjawali TaxID=1550579 RepID=A0A110B314_9SPHI|nr:TlpA disulfide reductase family protein [Mucilaginibacter gotjawali]MBB3053753.1 thiol-disulfide isomerase/thioredoxin [Mucilaginibacter gotjawali]BAU54013.1 Thiol-disulfide oxidoreductase ResA [Mucilaginibacter gotjawali]